MPSLFQGMNKGTQVRSTPYALYSNCNATKWGDRQACVDPGCLRPRPLGGQKKTGARSVQSLPSDLWAPPLPLFASAVFPRAHRPPRRGVYWLEGVPAALSSGGGTSAEQGKGSRRRSWASGGAPQADGAVQRLAGHGWRVAAARMNS